MKIPPFYLGFRQVDGSHYTNDRTYTYSLDSNVPQIQQIRMDDCAFFVNQDIDVRPVIKNRYTGDTKSMVIPYRVGNCWKYVPITVDSAQKMPTLISWLIDCEIDLNNVSEAEEFTMKLIF